MRIYATPKIFEKDYLKSIYWNLCNKKDFRKLENNSLTHIASALGHLDAQYDLYELLFEKPDQEIDLGKYSVYTKDLAAFVVMDHTYTRGYFAKPAASTAMVDTTNCQGVPLALEGAKRLYNKKYSSWLKGIDLANKEDAWRLDIFLPSDLCSIELDEEGETKVMDTLGLIRFYHNSIEFPIEVIQELRSRIANWQTAPNPRKIYKLSQEEESATFFTYADYYNRCAHKMRCLILRGWVWDEGVRNDDMITNPLDWDNHPKAIMFEGLKPQVKKSTNPYERYL